MPTTTIIDNFNWKSGKCVHMRPGVHNSGSTVQWHAAYTANGEIAHTVVFYGARWTEKIPPLKTVRISTKRTLARHILSSPWMDGIMCDVFGCFIIYSLPNPKGRPLVRALSVVISIEQLPWQCLVTLISIIKKFVVLWLIGSKPSARLKFNC